MNYDKNKLRRHTKEINDIMLLAQSSFKIVDYLTNPQSVIEREVINQNKFFKYSTELNWRIFVIEMAKLFSTSDRAHFYNLSKFIRKFKPDGEFGQVEEIDQYSMSIWEQNLNLEKIKIDNLMLQRDKLYSHNDPNREGIKNELSFVDAKELLNVVKRIISEIYAAVFDQYRSYDLLNEPVEELKKIVCELSILKQQQINDFIRHSEKNDIDPAEMGLG
ncbi:hypothetical protein [Flavobacterium sp. ZS1P14]|uniref:AbiU2 domain-containing protein n=1 Tax=Flavobacterium sp. ZS1P14 TaxID=3401729 RepID=UPI003AAC4D66